MGPSWGTSSKRLSPLIWLMVSIWGDRPGGLGGKAAAHGQGRDEHAARASMGAGCGGLRLFAAVCGCPRLSATAYVAPTPPYPLPACPDAPRAPAWGQNSWFSMTAASGRLSNRSVSTCHIRALPYLRRHSS
jgi:hypothetical protein